MITEATDEYCLAEGESAKLLTGHPWRRFVVLGDSVAEGLCSPVPGYSELQWADRLAAELQVPDYLNLGVSGLRTREILATQLAPALAFEPDLALVVGGGNDAFSARYDPDRVDGELTELVTALQATGADVITLGMFNVSYSPAVPDWLRPGLRTRMTELAERTQALATRLGTIHVHLTDHPLSSDPTLYSPDGRHGTARSDAVAAAETIRRLGAHLAR
ncbi:SGNH/GDSL hydrolase family protein [Streptomyces sp. SID13031]|uniref:SGNH/GDSL hydrolase family protein n=1 Tax=Streptomyces sp. SID13031 TaxID=2706046 RepID=UPI0013C66848|nr:SGNH/GDSL hydrolase family protein [Streptomyces sp. SID13031]NEA34113.1 SGNH/GDSL hydrolase family protein [Streptomyces sp. SID13031]